MRLLKIMILAVFVASITNVNVCSKIHFQKNTSDSRNTYCIISNSANASGVPLYSRQDQQGKNTIDYNSLHKICHVLFTKKSFLIFGSPDSHFAGSGKTNDYSLVLLHCLITI